MNVRLELLEQVSHAVYLARGGGGGSSSGGGGGGGGGFSSSSSSSYSSGSGGSSGPTPWWLGAFFWLFWGGFAIWIIYAIFFRPRKSGGTSVPAGFVDPSKKGTDEEKQLVGRAKEVFTTFQQAWAQFDLTAMKKVTSAEYNKKMVLELNVLKNYDRQDLMENVQIQGAYIQKTGDYSQGFVVFFQARANDKLVDTRENKTIFTDRNPFTEIWTFVKSGSSYVLDRIDQTTAEASKIDPGIQAFAIEQGFYYDPDFGWLMMPSRGAIFGPQGFGNADINNHVIGYYKDKIVEFYSYEPKAGAGLQPITVAQAILPKKYDDILVTEKSWYNFKPKLKGLNKIETESVEFNKKFAVWAANQDQATSFELLATNFMERIYALGFEVNIEVVDNVLYLYSPSTSIQYQDMLDILAWAFDEMKL